MVWDPQASHFPSKIQSTNLAFSETPPRTSFFRFLMRLGAQMLDFGIPLAPSRAQNDVQNPPSAFKKLTFSIKIPIKDSTFFWHALLVVIF